ncbi:hypothetical protein ACFSYH_05180 [Populibacterium corticicola]|uniref:DUF2975 domain-containing protein n=1 Tax=Populibacterium corticicola TaxID=1812826 RepID=A0ABW5XDZ0_9MICO
MTTDQLPQRLRKDYTMLLWLLWGAISIGAVTVVGASLTTIRDAIRNTNVPVHVSFDSLQGTAPVGENGQEVAVNIANGTLTVPSMPVAGTAAMLIEHALVLGATLTFVGALYLLFRQVTNGVVFSPRNTKIVDTLAVCAILVTGLAPFFGNMASNAAFAQVSNYTVDNPGGSNAIIGLTAAAGIGFLTSLFFRVGHSLAETSEGLV